MSFKIKWKDSYNTGNAKIDGEHKELFGIINELIELQDPDQDKIKMKVLLHRLGEFINKHFRDEEAYMEKIKYPGLELHHKGHQKIIEEVNNIVRQSKSLVELDLKLHGLFSAWLVEHVIGEDLKIKEWLDSQENSEKKDEKS